MKVCFNLKFGMALDTPPRNKTPDEILQELSDWKENKTRSLQFILVKNYGLEAAAQISFETRGGRKINNIRISHLGLVSNFTITSHEIKLESYDSLNDDNVSVLEENILKERAQILLDYFDSHPEDRPE